MLVFVHTFTANALRQRHDSNDGHVPGDVVAEKCGRWLERLERRELPFMAHILNTPHRSARRARAPLPSASLVCECLAGLRTTARTSPGRLRKSSRRLHDVAKNSRGRMCVGHRYAHCTQNYVHAEHILTVHSSCYLPPTTYHLPSTTHTDYRFISASSFPRPPRACSHPARARVLGTPPRMVSSKPSSTSSFAPSYRMNNELLDVIRAIQLSRVLISLA